MLPAPGDKRDDIQESNQLKFDALGPIVINSVGYKYLKTRMGRLLELQIGIK
jgi:hypothetical protein